MTPQETETPPELIITPLTDNPGWHEAICPYSGETRIIALSEHYDPENLTATQHAEICLLLGLMAHQTALAEAVIEPTPDAGL